MSVSSLSSSVQSNLISVEEDSNVLLNISSQTDPEVSDLGSKDSVATAYGISGNSKGFWESTKIFMGWILTGTLGQILAAVFGGLLGIGLLYFITKWIRAGF